jgi:hypothetical protein
LSLSGSISAPCAQRAEELAQAGHAFEGAVQQLAGHVLELQAGHGGVHIAADGRQRLQLGALLGRGGAAVQQQLDGGLFRFHRLVDGHEVEGQLFDRFLQQQAGLDQVSLDFGQMPATVVRHAGQQALDVGTQNFFSS